MGKWTKDAGLSPIDMELVPGRLKLTSRGPLGQGIPANDKRRPVGGGGGGGGGDVREGGDPGGGGGNFSKDYKQFIAKLKEEKKKFKDFTNN